MSEYYGESIEKHDMLENDINELKNRCAALENNVRAMDQKVININRNIEQIRGSIEGVMDTLNKIPSPSYSESNNNMNDINMGKQRMEANLGDMVGRPLRKAAVSTVGVMLTATEKTAQRVSGIRKGIEEIILEAHQRNNEKRMSPEEQN